MESNEVWKENEKVKKRKKIHVIMKNTSVPLFVFVCVRTLESNSPSPALLAHLGCMSDRMAIRLSHQTPLPFYFFSYLLAHLVWWVGAFQIPIKASGKGTQHSLPYIFTRPTEVHSIFFNDVLVQIKITVFLFLRDLATWGGGDK